MDKEVMYVLRGAAKKKLIGYGSIERKPIFVQHFPLGYSE